MAKKASLVLALITLASSNGAAQQAPPGGDLGEINAEVAAKAFPRRGYSPYANRNYPTRVFWGD